MLGSGHKHSASDIKAFLRADGDMDMSKAHALCPHAAMPSYCDDDEDDEDDEGEGDSDDGSYGK